MTWQTIIDSKAGQLIAELIAKQGFTVLAITAFFIYAEVKNDHREVRTELRVDKLQCRVDTLQLKYESELLNDRRMLLGSIDTTNHKLASIENGMKLIFIKLEKYKP